VVTEQALQKGADLGHDGIEIERELPTLYTFRDGLIVRVDGFTDRAEALKAAGLSE